MAVSAEFRDFVLDQLRAVTPVTSKRMFAGVGVYSRETFFAILYDETLYFKADETTRPAFAERGCRQFDPMGRGEKSPGAMGYFEVPVDVIENEDELRTWTRDAIAVARRAKQKKKKK